MKKILLASVATVALFGLLAYFASQDVATGLNFLQTSDFSHFEKEFIMFAAKYGRSYKDKHEFMMRMHVFIENLKKIEHSNSQNKDYTLGVNHFADWTKEEFKAILGTKPVQHEVTFSSKHAPKNDVDWRAQGHVHPVKNQGSCGSCWAFAATSPMESAVSIAGRGLTALSEQQMVDCSGPYGNNGCRGGWMHYAFAYAVDHAIAHESDYPYQAADMECRHSTVPGAVKLSGFDHFDQSDATLAAGVARGPVGVAVQADSSVFQFYREGIVRGPECGTMLNHGVTAVGMWADHWLVKNSWGEGWGDAGYIKIGREEGEGVCGINMNNSQPKL